MVLGKEGAHKNPGVPPVWTGAELESQWLAKGESWKIPGEQGSQRADTGYGGVQGLLFQRH